MNFLFLGYVEFVSLIKRRSKVVVLFFCIFLFLIASYNVRTDDRDVYRYFYYSVNTINVKGDVEAGFQVLILIFRSLGLNFESFYALLVAISILLFIKAIFYYSNNPAIVIGLYTFFPFILDAEQIRSFLGTSIVLLGFSKIFREEKRGYISFILSCIIAGSFHSSCYIYLVFILVNASKENVYFWMLFLVGIFTVGRVALTKVIGSLGFMEEKVTYYIGGNTNLKEMLFYYIFYLVLIFGTVFLISKIHNENELKKDKTAYQNSIIFKVNIISICFIPLMMSNPNFERLFRFLIVFDYAAISNYIGKQIHSRKEIIILSVLYFYSSSRFLSHILGAGWERLYKPYFVDGFRLF